MASVAFPQLAKSHTLSTSHAYGYAYHLPTNGSLPTILFLHGFPSSCYDWRHQIQFFSQKGYGVLVPDLLGYGDTAKPTTLEDYKTRRMATEVIELLDHEGINNVHAVGHDTGCILLSRLANYFPNRLLSCTFLDVPYSKPGEHFDLDTVNALTKQFLGYERFGYVEFFTRPDAGDILNQHSDSFFSLFYPQNPNLWIDHVGPAGAMEAWLLQDRKGPEPEYVNKTVSGILHAFFKREAFNDIQEQQIHQHILRNKYASALKWYHALVGNINEHDEIQANLDPVLPMPALMVCPQPTKLELPGVEEQMKQVASDFTFKRVTTSGHWVQLEARDEINTILKNFFRAVEPSTV